MVAFFRNSFAALGQASRRVGRALARAALAYFRWTVAVARSRFVVRPLALGLALLAGTLRTATLGFLVGGLALCALFGAFERVPLATVGVQQRIWGEGVVERDFEPGLWSSFLLANQWHYLDATTHYASFGWESDGAALPTLSMRTKDGNQITLCVTVPYRIRRGEAWQLVRDGLKSTYRDVATATMKSVLMEELARLSTLELADTETRLERCRLALPRLEAALARYHLEPETIQIHQTMFWIEYEKKLQQKQLTHQKARLAEASAAVEEYLRSDTLADETDAQEKLLRAELDKELESVVSVARLEIARIQQEAGTHDKTSRSQADGTYVRELAAGDLAMVKAEALKDSLGAATLETEGGRYLLARRAAENLRVKSVTLNSNDPRVPSLFDLDAMVRLFVGAGAAGEPVALQDGR